MTLEEQFNLIAKEYDCNRRSSFLALMIIMKILLN